MPHLFQNATRFFSIIALALVLSLLTALTTGPVSAQSDPTGASTSAASTSSDPAKAADPETASADAKTSNAQAEAKPTASPPLKHTDLESLLETLEDEAKRTEFVKTLKDMVTAQQVQDGDQTEPAAATIFALISEQVERTSQIAVDAAAFAAGFPEFVADAIDAFEDPVKRERWIEVVSKLAIVLAAAFLVEWAARAVLSRARESLAARTSDSWGVRLGLLLLLGIIQLVPIAAFAAAAYGILPLLEPKVVTRLVAIALINANVLARLSLLATRFFLAPTAPNLRLFPMEDAAALRAYRWARRIIHTSVYGYFGLQAALLLGLPRSLYLLLLQLLGLTIAIMLVIVIIKYRSNIAVWIRGTRSTAPAAFEVWALLRRRLADVWHLLAVAYVVAVYFVWSLGVSGSLTFMVRGTLLTIAIFIGANVIAVAAGHLVNRAFTGQKEPGADPGSKADVPQYLPFVHRIVDLLVYATAALALLDVWGADVSEWLATDAGARLISSLVTIVLVIGASFLAFEIVNRAIERYLEAKDEEGEAVERSARARTLLPLARKALLVLLVIMAFLVTASEIGIDIAPLIAGAGVVGIAVGFGAQSLVRDVITGFFILLENTFSVGDVIDLGGNAGVVEAISVRTVKLRDLSGTVHTVPFGDVTRVKNLTKDFSYYVMDIGIAYRENVDDVIKVIREVGADLQQDVAFRFSILDPIEILGVDQFADSAVIIKARIKTRPIRQWAVGREFNRRMKNRFDELGIEIPFPHQTIYFGADKDGEAPPAHLRVRVQAPGVPLGDTGGTAQGPAPGAAPG